VELRHIRYFLAVAEERHFTRGAEKLGISQPPVSQQIRDLEDELGAALFRRVPHGAELTEAGEAFLIEARSILAGAERAKLAAQRAHRGQSGMLSVGFSGTAAFSPLLARAKMLFMLGSRIRDEIADGAGFVGVRSASCGPPAAVQRQAVGIRLSCPLRYVLAGTR
jgi:DNA-binding transcriptional LysR family regulator